MPVALRDAILVAAAREAGCRAGPARLHAGWEQLSGAASGQRADLGSGWSFEIAFDRLRLVPPSPECDVAPAPIGSSQGTLDWGTWRLEWTLDAAPDVQQRAASTAWFVPGDLAVRSWRAGDRLRPLGAAGRRLAVRCFQDAKVPSSSRSGWPIIESHGTIAWIPGVCRSALLMPVPGTAALRLEVSAIE
jgi:tRNA(Ile)-lysidine synthetase-like protein